MGGFKKSRNVAPKLLVDSSRLTEIMTVTDVNARHNTLSAAQIKAGIVVHTSATGAGNVTMDTAANIIAGVPLTEDNQCVKVYYINDGDQDLTFAQDDGNTCLVADTGAIIMADEGAFLLIQRTSSTACKMFCLGGGASD